MKNFLFGLIFSILSFFSAAQSGWESGNYYMQRGQAVENCGYSYAKYDYWGRYLGQYTTCAYLQWERKDYGGYVYVWSPIGWSTQWYQGYAWYCYWSPSYEKRVW